MGYFLLMAHLKVEEIQNDLMLWEDLTGMKLILRFLRRKLWCDNSAQFLFTEYIARVDKKF